MHSAFMNAAPLRLPMFITNSATFVYDRSDSSISIYVVWCRVNHNNDWNDSLRYFIAQLSCRWRFFRFFSSVFVLCFVFCGHRKQNSAHTPIVISAVPVGDDDLFFVRSLPSTRVIFFVRFVRFRFGLYANYLLLIYAPAFIPTRCVLRFSMRSLKRTLLDANEYSSIFLFTSLFRSRDFSFQK